MKKTAKTWEKGREGQKITCVADESRKTTWGSKVWVEVGTGKTFYYAGGNGMGEASGFSTLLPQFIKQVKPVEEAKPVEEDHISNTFDPIANTVRDLKEKIAKMEEEEERKNALVAELEAMGYRVILRKK